MSETMDPMATDVDQQELAQQLLARAKEQGIGLVGPDGLLNRLTKNVLETAWKRSWTSIPDTENTTWAGAVAGTPTTAPAPRRS
ncbi:hypothetical protein QFZ79_001707 [Arthrobacter sp. V4I6]|nr:MULTISPECIES: hypothetical protein [unclassified Arthrobacter]MDQ0819412.1 hypothetical protein [Arthrobacter sp. V1I7]MDQ0853596.1 hypothetical protein [Arthrobacter sp. V4I6]